MHKSRACNGAHGKNTGEEERKKSTDPSRPGCGAAADSWLGWVIRRPGVPGNLGKLERRQH